MQFHPTRKAVVAQRQSQTTRRLASTGLLAVATMLSFPSFALDVDAGDYTALPSGTNLGLVYYQHASRDAIYSQGSKVAGRNKLDSDVGILRGVHFMDIGGFTVDPQFLLPFGRLEGKDDLASLGHQSGMGDLILAATVWVVNNPKTNSYFGLTPFLQLPTGQYDKNRTLNLGENRWKFTMQGGFITGLTDKLLLDVIADVTVFGKNDEFGSTSATLKQKAQYQGQTYLRYNVTPTWDLRGGLSYTGGGETEINGVSQGDRLRTTKFAVGSGYFVTPSVQLLANYGRDISVRNGFREDNRLNLRLLKIF